MRLAIKKILHLYKPQLIFFCETKLSSRQVNDVCRELGIENCLMVDCRGKSGGLAMLWSSEITVQITSYNNHHIDPKIQNANGRNWRWTGIYGHPKASQKKHTWSLLRRLVGLNKKIGGLDRNAKMVAELRESVKDCKLVDVGCRGHPFTRSNRHFGPII